MTDDVIILEPGEKRAQKIAKAISSQTAGDILRLLAGGAKSLTDITDMLAVPMNTAKYHVDNLLDAGLITVTDTKYSVKGREVKLYSLTNQLLIVAPGQADIRSLLLKYAASLRSDPDIPIRKRPSSSANLNGTHCASAPPPPTHIEAPVAIIRRSAIRASGERREIQTEGGAMVRRKLLSQLAWLPFLAMGGPSDKTAEDSKVAQDHDEECVGVGRPNEGFFSSGTM